ncbi:hypothetical protein AB1Y20_011224 [Prymnesium parvum]|uniref:Uncharacterized protein n=1 Tax=Prymnesium parvum TaxID=97485 RepID=A0AB34IM99_PRYPA
MEGAAAALFAGHAAMVDEEYEAAIAHYSEAIDRDSQCADAYSKRAAAHLQRRSFAAAAEDAAASVALTPTAKALEREGRARFGLADFVGARAAFVRAAELDGASREMARWVRKCDAELRLAAVRGGGGGGAPSGGAAQPVSDPSKVRHEWYQTQTHVVVSILARHVPEEKVAVEFGEARVGVAIELEGGAKYQLNLSLFHKLVPGECKYSVSNAKVELTMKKHTPGKWEALEGEGEGEVKPVAVPPPATAPPSTSVYSGSKKNWDAIDSTLKKEEEEEKPEGEEALNKLFRDIYGKASDETRRAMNKSFQTSGGTVLSTNWDEVAQKDYEKERTAPNGQEWKKWG